LVPSIEYQLSHPIIESYISYLIIESQWWDWYNLWLMLNWLVMDCAFMRLSMFLILVYVWAWKYPFQKIKINEKSELLLRLRSQYTKMITRLSHSTLTLLLIWVWNFHFEMADTLPDSRQRRNKWTPKIEHRKNRIFNKKFNLFFRFLVKYAFNISTLHALRASWLNVEQSWSHPTVWFEASIAAPMFWWKMDKLFFWRSSSDHFGFVPIFWTTVFDRQSIYPLLVQVHIFSAFVSLRSLHQYRNSFVYFLFFAVK